MSCEKLDGKVAIITGATSGIGRATTELFAEEGAKVVFGARREEMGKQFEEDLKKKGFDAKFVRTDVAKEEDLKNLVQTTLDTYGQIDILYNNAGISRPPIPCHEMDMEKDYDFLFDVNLRSYFVLTKLVIPHMLKNGKGSVVNTASVAAEIGVPMCSTYAAVKGGIKQMTKSLAAEYATQGIRFNSVFPGTVQTDLLPEGDAIKEIISTIPMKRLGTVDEIAQGVLFLASDDASYCTGTMLVIDGGLTAV
ncbi:SDR family NAD(P)-dependent oxidoreductase [Methanobacterium petrolearium]|uniref:SDR family NAD(P)-dependent oxidoreductase n=1 Tax=Methanobacterium petrolearium TaxID=710190 RepID=UPI001AE2A3D3|nr:glucose 1-dehydrogenase [Methanobacterium petrolearium]MBP1945211.1 NAD(P)-dependent dehydrogenase (short-subunit alcohol dehydrogenase family) [Methanobacterium petrolearium]BDZ71144.1 short-chain dehydrogenase [Methanobacterium petrolearium]